MAYEMRPGQGSAFREDKREEWMADYRGKVMLPDGTTCWLDVFKKRKQDGEVYVSVKIRPMQARADAQTDGERSYDPPPQRNAPNSKVTGGLDDDSIPFAPEC